MVSDLNPCMVAHTLTDTQRNLNTRELEKTPNVETFSLRTHVHTGEHTPQVHTGAHTINK